MELDTVALGFRLKYICTVYSKNIFLKGGDMEFLLLFVPMFSLGDAKTKNNIFKMQ